MSQTTPPTITPAPTAPIRGTSTFKTAVDAFLTWLALVVAQFQALATNCYNNAVDAYNSAVAAAASAAASLSSASDSAASSAAAVSASGATLWVSGASVSQNAAVISPATRGTYRRKTATGSGTTDPSADTTNYVLISNFAYFQTADQTITSGGTLTIAHGLGRTPVMWQAFIKNVTAENGYVAGNIIPAPPPWYDGSSMHGGAVVTADATNLYVRFASPTNAFQSMTGTITNANWSFLVRVQA